MSSQLKIIEIACNPDKAQATGLYVGQTFDLVKDTMVLGRHSENDIPLFSLDKVRHHGLLHKEGDNHHIEDISGGRLPILVNNAPITETTVLRDGDIITVYIVKFVYIKDNKSEPDVCSCSTAKPR